MLKRLEGLGETGRKGGVPRHVWRRGSSLQRRGVAWCRGKQFRDFLDCLPDRTQHRQGQHTVWDGQTVRCDRRRRGSWWLSPFSENTEAVRYNTPNPHLYPPLFLTVASPLPMPNKIVDSQFPSKSVSCFHPTGAATFVPLSLFTGWLCKSPHCFQPSPPLLLAYSYPPPSQRSDLSDSIKQTLR